MGDELKMVKSMLRSVLISCKEGVAAATLQREYKEIVGDFLPYKKFGFSCLEDFILSMPDVVRISRRGQDVMCHAVADESTKHIQDLVSKQRSKKPKKPVRQLRGRGSGSGFLANRHARGRQRSFQPNYPPPDRMTSPFTPRQGGMTPYIGSRPLSPLKVHCSNTPSGTRTIRLGDNPLLARTMKEVHASRGYQGPRYETPPRFKKRASEKQTSPPSAQSRGGWQTKKHEFAKIESDVDYMSKLTALLQEIRVNPVTEMTEGYGGFACSITINKTKYGSEDVFATAAEAKQAAAKVALSKLDIKKPQDIQVQGAAALPPAKLAQVKSRIQEVLKDRVNGLWGTVIPFEYRRRFNEEAPQDILEMVKTWPDIAKVEFVANTEREIVYPVIDDTNKDLVIPYEQFLKTCEEKVIVYMTFIHHPSFFCVQRDDTTMEEITEKLQSHCKLKSAPDKTTLQKNQYCAGIYSGDKCWTRGQILDIVDNNSVQVLFVDFGNCETVKVGDIRWLSPELAAYPVQAITCSLYGIQPLQDEAKWSQKSLTTFAELVQDQELVAIPKYIYDDLVEVDLYLSSDPSESIADKLVKAGVVRSIREKIEELEKNDPDPIILPEDKFWDVFITYINASTNSVMMRLVGAEHSERLEAFQETLEQAWKNCDSEAPVIEGGTFIVFDEELYHRVRILSTEGRKISCYFLDHGDSDEFLPEQLKPLDPRVNKQLPYQAIEISLYGLEDVCNNEEANVVALESLCELALTKSCVAEVMARESIPSLILYDTSSEIDININETILEAIDPASHSDTSSQTSKNTDSSLQTSQSAINVDITVSQSENSLTTELDASDSQQSSLNTDNSGFTCVNGDTSARPKLKTPYIPPPPPVDSTDIYETQGTVRSPEVPDNDKDSSSLHRVSLPDSVAELAPTIKDKNDNRVTKKQINRLEPFPLPEVGSYFDVHVLFALSPSDFTCVPYHKLDEMLELFQAMKNYYDGKPPVKMTVLDIKIGEFYAGCENGTWFRVQAKHVISNELITMYQVDQGTYAALTMDEIQPLYRQFFTPPMMAIKANLGGVEPMHSGGSWTEGAKYKFMDMATQNDLVALVHDRDETTRTLKVSLVDTNGEVDVCLEEVLIKMNFARPVEKAQ